MTTLRDKALEAHATASASAKTQQILNFKSLLRRVVDIDANPTDTEITIDGVKLSLSGSDGIVFMPECAKCGLSFPSVRVTSIADLGRELSRPIADHGCNPKTERNQS